MAAIVIVHLGISMIHRTAHTSAHVPLSPAANIFVFTALTLFGLWIRESIRAASPDHISQVDMQWRPLFGTTAVLLVITEALGISLAVRPLRVRRTK